MSASFALCETRRQVEAISALRRSGSLEAGRIIAVLPSAAWALGERGESYGRLEDYYEESSLLAVAESSLAARREWIRETDDWLGERFQPWKDSGFKPARLTGYFLKSFFDILDIRLTIAAAFLRAERPTRVILFRPEPDPPEWHLGFNTSVNALVFPLAAAAAGVPVLELPALKHDVVMRYFGIPPRAPRNLRGLLRTAWRTLPPSLRVQLRSAIGSARAPRGAANESTAPRLHLAGGYDVGAVCREAERRGIAYADFDEVATRWSSEAGVTAEPPTSLWSALKQQEFFWRPTTIHEVRLRAIAEPRLDAWWRDSVLPISRAFAHARAGKPRSFCSAVMTTALFRREAIAFAAAMRSEGIPVVSYQHGGFQGPCEFPGLDVADLALTDAYATYGEGVAEYFDARRRRSPDLARSAPIGSPRLEQLAPPDPRQMRTLRRRLTGTVDRHVVLYIPTMSVGYSRQLSCDAYPDVPYFELRCDVFRAMRDVPVTFVYKDFLSAVPDPTPQAMRRLHPEAVHISDVRLTTLMWAVDTIVIDFPSTALLEAARTDKPIVLLADKRSLTILPEARPTLERRVRVADTPQSFLAAILEAVGAGPAADRHLDDSFIRRYGVHQGAAAARALDFVIALGDEAAARQKAETPSPA